MNKAKPTKQHLEWADMEIGVIIHYIMEIYNPDFKAYKTDAVRTELSPDRFNPQKLDPEQWVRSAAELGAKYAVFVANHCTGFSLWQTKVNDYSCASMKWKDGKGDIFREFIDACRKYNIKPGVYYSTGCNGYYNINDEVRHDYKAEYYQNYVKCVERQLEELWSEYGEMFEIWFDGGIVPKENGGPDVYPILKKYQPNAIAFQGPEGYEHNIRWVGNENGYAPEDCWSTLKADEKDNLSGNPDGELWNPAETDFPNRLNEAFGDGWGWREGEENMIFSPEHLLDCYVKSVGRNTNMLIGMAISADGDFQDEKQFIEFGKLLRETFGTPITEISEQTGTSFSVINAESAPIKYLVLCEDISEGHSIRGFSVYADGVKISEGKCVGHKRIIPLENITSEEIKIEITDAVDTPHMKSIAIY